MTTFLYPATAEKAATVRAELAAAGVSKARVRVMRNGALRLVLASAADRDAARDALVMAGALTATGTAFTDPQSRFAWNGATEVFVRFAAP